MEKDVRIIMELAGNKYKFTIFIIAMNLVLWINVSVLNFSISFIEAKPKVVYMKNNEEITTKLNYEICDKYDYIVKEDYKYSIITDFKDGTECNKLKNSLIGTIHSIGILLGNLLFHRISSILWYKNILFFFHIAHAIFLLISIFWNNYYYFQVINCFVMFLTKSILNSSLVVNNEVVDLKYKALISSFVNSGLGLGGMFYVLMYYLIEDWKYVFIVGVCLSAVSGIIIKIFYSDSLVQCLVNKYYEKFYKNLLYIARMNGREKEFKEGIINDEKYKSCLEKLKEYTNNDTEQKVTGQQTEVIQIKNAEKNGIETNKQTDKNLVISSLREQTNPESNKNNHEEKKQIKGTILDLFKYRSVRYITIILSLGWFCNSTLFYGLVIGIKTLKGSQYRNSAILYLCDFCAYNISGFFSNSKLGRKRSLQIFTLAYGIFCLIMFLVFEKNKDVVVAFYFCARLSMICGFCVYYSFAFESYPISVANLGYSFNSACSALAGIIVPFIIEYIQEKYVFLIYAIEGIVCTFLFFFLEETRGKERRDNIKEIDKQLKKENINDEKQENVQ